MSTLSVATIKSQNTLPPAVQNSSGTEIGTFCRAWVNFNGTGTVAIRASFNVSSITDNGTGDYTVNFTTAMSDANYCYSGSFSANYAIVYPAGLSVNTAGSAESAPTTSSFRFVCVAVTGVGYDPKYLNVSIFR